MCRNRTKATPTIQQTIGGRHEERAGYNRCKLYPIGQKTMCLAIPGQITELLDGRNNLAMVDILGVRRKVSIDLLQDDPPIPGDWVLIHVGFAMSKISGERAAEQLEMLSMLGEASAARDELALDDPASSSSLSPHPNPSP